MVNVLRTNGKPIISSSKGYKLSDNLTEIFECVFNLKHRANKICNAASGMMLNALEINLKYIKSCMKLIKLMRCFHKQ